MHLRYSAAIAAAIGLPSLVQANSLQLQFELPRLNVAEYHRPYVAAWIEHTGGRPPISLMVLHDQNMSPEEGNKWLRELRQWWRRAGRGLDMPADGISGATRPPGTHRVQFMQGKAPFPQLEPGSYRLVVEASREQGELEMVTLPFDWPPKEVTQQKARGITELREVSIEVKP